MRYSTRTLATTFAASAALLAGLCLAPAASAEQDLQDVAASEFFEKHIRPVLVERCYQCHSAEADELEGGLLLDSRAGTREGGDSGRAIVPGDPDGSLLIRAIRYTDSERQMPPDGKLSAEEIAAFETWVRQGALDPRTEPAGERPAGDPASRWAFQPLSDPSPPEVSAAGAINPIDRFLLARLEEQGLGYAPPTDKPALLRRATYDLIGLPPTPEETAAFLADSSPDALAKVVDRLLASPQYGQRWGRHWLDLVRYTDDFDEAWRYRDWVVDAFNRDLPYDQFVQQQIAGDLLPAARPGPINAEGIVATTMLSIGQWSGLDRKKRLTDIVDDQIDTIGRTFMGLTVACARCHNHKFDPITTADYYGLAGVFLSSRVFSDRAYLSHGTHRLRIPLVPQDQVDQHQRQTAEIRRLEERIEAAVDDHYSQFARGLLPLTGRYLVAAWQYQHRAAGEQQVSLDEFATERGLHPFALRQWIARLGESRPVQRRLLHLPVDNYDGEPGTQAWMGVAERPWWVVNSNEHDVPIETFLLPPRSISVNPGTEGGAVGWNSPIAGTVRITGKLTDGDPHDGTGVAWFIDHQTKNYVRELSSGSMPNGGSATLEQGRTPERLDGVRVEPGDVIYLQVWLRTGDAHYDISSVELSIASADGSGQWDLVGDVADDFLSSNPHHGQGNTAVWKFHDMCGENRRKALPAADGLIDRFRDAIAGADSPGQWSVVETAAQGIQRAIHSAGPDSPIVEDLAGPRSPFWAGARDDAKYLPAEAQAQLAARTAELESLKQSLPPLPHAHGVQEGGIRYSLYPGVQDVPIHIRGSYDQLGETVPRRFPRALAGDDQPPISSGSGRQELARWIASAEHPLTARVIVNRIWQHHFGEGIVRTPSNFGSMGERPTHPELLDFLARRLIESNWSIKSVHRLIMLSDAWRQSTRPSAETERADPENRLFGRMNRRRLEAEPIRDSLLALAGRLDLRAGGPPDADAASPRRMLYLRVSRANRSGFGPVFDAADSSIHVDKRTASIVAPQALYLMNDALVVEAARGLANRPDVLAAGQPDERIGMLYRLVYGREPSEAELAVGRGFVETAANEAGEAAAGTSPAAAGTSPAGAWEMYAQALLLSNEFLLVD